MGLPLNWMVRVPDQGETVGATVAVISRVHRSSDRDQRLSGSGAICRFAHSSIPRVAWLSSIVKLHVYLPRKVAS